MKLPALFRRKKDYMVKRDEDILQIRSAFFDVIDKQSVLTDTIKILMSMADKQQLIYMWLKDHEDRYIFASRNTREALFNNKHISEIINRTDAEISTGKKINFDIKNLSKLTPENLPEISEYIDKDTIICNLTDIVTRAFNKPCKFVEVVNNMIWIVWKEPLFKYGVYSGSTGYALDMTNQKEEVYKLIADRIATKEAFKIDNTDNYYLTSYSFPVLCPRRFI